MTRGGTLSNVSPDTELLLIFGTLHLIAIGFGVMLLWMFMRSSTTDEWRPPGDDDEGGGGGGNDRVGPGPQAPRPRGGLPLPSAAPAPVRLRAPARLADHYERPGRRPAHPPERAPVRHR